MAFSLKNYKTRTFKESFNDWVFQPEKSYCSGVCDDLHIFDFSHPCFVHDGYYGDRIKETQKLLNSLLDKNERFVVNNHTSRYFADRRFYYLMRKEVKKQSSSWYWRCLGEIIAYRRFMGVRLMGWRFYKERQ